MKHAFLVTLLLAGKFGYAQSEVLPYTELFCPVDTTWQGDTLVVPKSPLHYSILLQEGDIVSNIEKGTNGALKGGFGGLFYDRNNREDIIVNDVNFSKNIEGRLYMSLLDNKSGTVGDGGGYLALRVKQNEDNSWEVVPQTVGETTFNARYFDLETLGGTYNSNGIHLGYSALSSVIESPTKGNIFMYDGWAESNADLSPGFTSTPNFILPETSPEPGLSIEKYLNMGWVTEINKQTGMPVRKLYHAGRANIGGLNVTSQKSADLPEEATYTKELIYTTQTQPAVIIKYEYADNLVYAYQQDEGSPEGKWMMLNDMDVDGSVFPLTFEELSDIRKVALQKGATMFNKLGAIVKEKNGSYYIAETGGAAPAGTFTDEASIHSGVLASHLTDKVNADGSTNDYYGRILKLYHTGEGKIVVTPHLQGGVTIDGRYTFSNPKSLWNYNFEYTPEGGSLSSAQYLVISEEVTETSFRRNPSFVSAENQVMNEIYFLDTDIPNPDLSHLRPFTIGPKGAELQAAFSVEGPSPLFLSIRYPNTSNTSPYNKSLLLAIDNFEEYFTHPESCGWITPPPGTDTSATTLLNPALPGKDELVIWPNPVSRTLYFDKKQASIELFNLEGQLIKSAQQVKEIDIFDITPGMYLIRNDKKQVRKIVIR